MKKILLILLLLAVATMAQAKSVTLSWEPSPSADVVGYKVYYDNNEANPEFTGTGAVEGDSPIDVGNVLTFTLTGLVGEQAQPFAVTAYDAAGNESVMSNIVISPLIDETAPEQSPNLYPPISQKE